MPAGNVTFYPNGLLLAIIAIAIGLLLAIARKM